MSRRILQKHCRRYLTSRPDFNLQPSSCLLKLNTGIQSIHLDQFSPCPSGENTFDEILKSANDKAEYFVGRVPLIGIGEDNNCSYMKGPRNAPSIIRQAFLSASGSFDQYYCNDKKFINTETLLLDCGNLERNPNDSEANHNNICQTVQKISQINNTSNATDGRSPHPLLVLGGDHSITYPVLLGHQQASAGDKIAVINFNAHPDLVVDPNNMYSHASPFYNLLETDTIHHLLQIGLRCMTKEEEPIVYKYKNRIKQLHMEQLFGFGVPDYYQQIYDQMNLWMRKCHLNNITKFYISIDRGSYYIFIFN